MAVKPIPDGFHAVTPYLLVGGVDELLTFLQAAFDAKVMERMATPDGTVSHAQAKIGDSMVMMGDPRGRCEPGAASIYVYVPNVDEVYARAIAAGGTSVMEPADQFYGDRNGGVMDPLGNTWWMATHIEDVPPDELLKRAKAAGKA
jgi:PhnB protein